MFERFKNWVLKLFGKKTEESNEEMIQSERDTMRYLDISSENLTSIIANALATLTFGDSQFRMDADTEMASIIKGVLENEFTKAKKNVACGLGVGMIVSIPYCIDNGLGRKIYIDTITKDRFFITGMQGSDITQGVALADVKKIDKVVYTRWTEYSIEDGKYVIRNKAMKNSTEVMLNVIDSWDGIEPEIVIDGVDRLPIAMYKCPAGGKRPDDIVGLPITFGCDSTMAKIKKTFGDIESEFDRKKVKVFADRGLLKPIYDEQGNLVKQEFDDELFVRMSAEESFGTEIFSPEFRDTSYYTKLQSHFEFLEKQIGVSKGILTELTTGTATATEIRRSTYQTFCLVDDIRKGYIKYLNDLAYGVEVLAVAFGLASASEYEFKITWGTAFLEDRQETFNHLSQSVSLGAERVAELRMFNHPEEDLEEAQAVVDDIAENNPPLASLIEE